MFQSRALPMSLLLCIAFAGCSSSNSFSNAGSGGGTTQAVSVTVSGASATRLGATTQFTATVTGTSSTAVTWQVNGVAGGSANTGTISTAGVYTSPATLPSGNAVTITALSQLSPTQSGSLTEAIWNPVPVLTSAAATQTSGATSYLIDVRGSSFVQGAQIIAAGAPAVTSSISATELQATIVPASGATTVAIAVANPDPGSAQSATANVTITVIKTSVAAAARLLDQATFGPTLNDIQHVQTIGLDVYLTEQFTATPSQLAVLPNPLPANCSTAPKPCVEDEWWHATLNGPDQLRQRVAFALSELFVVSQNSVDPNDVLQYMNFLDRDAFANFQVILKDMTPSTAMGNYLNMIQSGKPASGQIANENFAREFMQLFTIGLNQLNQDGTLKLDANGNPIPTYTEAQVEAFARAYTGWTYATATGAAPAKFSYTPVYAYPMAAVEAQHDMTPKILLGGTTLPAGQTAETDLAGAIGNVFAQPNVGPFVCRQLIQHLVASNPSPAYVSRIAAIFADNGNGVRGDMRAVVRAILLDPEARAGDTDPTQDGGHLREPILYVANLMRALGFTNTTGTDFYYSLSNYSGNLGQRPYESASVFNFFPPNYVIPGSVNAPEFDLENTATAILRLSLANSFVMNQVSGFSIDLSATSALGQMASNPANLVDALGTMFLHGQMPANMRTAIINHVTSITNNNAERARVATYLVITSSEYKVLH